MHLLSHVGPNRPDLRGDNERLRPGYDYVEFHVVDQLLRVLERHLDYEVHAGFCEGEDNDGILQLRASMRGTV